MKIFRYITLLFVITACIKKEISPQDDITEIDVRGIVYNGCNDSGLAGVDVYLETFSNKALYSKVKTVSDKNGEFVFAKAPIHSDKQFSYAIFIESVDGTSRENVATFVGATMYFENFEATTYMKPRVAPSFYRLYLQFYSLKDVAEDTLFISLSQPVFHRNFPLSLYLIPGKISGSVLTGNTVIGDYPAGKWNVEIKARRNNILTTRLDSIYMAPADTRTYSISW
jgi:hypothetical protein